MVDCVDKLKEQYPELSKVEARQLKDAFDDLNIRFANEQEQLNSLRKEMYNQVELAAYERQAAELTHVITLKKNLEHVVQPAFRGKADMGIDSLVMFTPYNAKNQTRNAADLASTYRAKYEGMLDQALEKNGAINQINDPEFAKAVFKDFYDRYWDRHTPNKYGSTVTEAVDSIIKVNKSMIKGMKAVGSTIRYNETHLVSQTYDPSKVVGNRAEWIKDMAERIDLHRSFGPQATNPKQAQRMLEDMADRMGRIDLEKTDARFSVMGGKRSIIFKDGDGAYDMMVKYGYADLGHGLKSGIKRMSKKYGLTSLFGNDSDRGIKELKNYVEDVMSQRVNFSSFDAGVDILRGVGNTYSDPNGIIAKAVVPATKAIKTIATLRYLGSSAPKILMDLPLTVLTNTAQGMSLPKATSKTMINALESVVAGSKGRRELAREIWQNMENHKMAMYSELDGGPDMWSKVSETFYSASGMSYLGEIMQNTSMRTTIDNFTNIIKKGPMDRLKLQNLQRSGFSGADATALRKVVNSMEGDRLSPQNIIDTKVNIGDEAYKNNLAERLATHYLQLTNEGITTTDNRIQVWQAKHKPIDSVERQGKNIFSTFLTSITKETININKAVRTISPEGKVRSKTGMAAMAGVAVTFALMDYATDELKKYISGNWDDKEPTTEEFRKHMIDSGSWGLIISGITRIMHGKYPTNAPAPLGVLKDITKNIENEFKIVAEDPKALKKAKRSTVLERQLQFLFEMSPAEKFWARGLLSKAYDSIIEDTGKRSRSRRTRKRRSRR